MSGLRNVQLLAVDVSRNWVNASGPDMKTRPPGTRCIRGYRGGALKLTIVRHVPFFQTCWVSFNVEFLTLPKDARTLPSDRVTAVGYQRPPLVGASVDQVFLKGS